MAQVVLLIWRGGDCIGLEILWMEVVMVVWLILRVADGYR